MRREESPRTPPPSEIRISRYQRGRGDGRLGYIPRDSMAMGRGLREVVGLAGSVAIARV
jgi:hypothetical protein